MKYELKESRSFQFLQPVYRIDSCVEDLLHFIIAKLFSDVNHIE